jgi:hypothetical protein
VKVSEAHATIAPTLDGILSGNGAAKFVICNWSEPEEHLFGLYEVVIEYLRTKLGKPNYSGRGPVYPAGNEGCDPGVFIGDYSRAMQISWWRSDTGVLAALVSSHDADSLHCLTVEFLKEKPGTQ